MERARELADLARSDWAAEQAPLVADTGWCEDSDTGGARVLVFQAEGMIIVLEVTIRNRAVRVDGLVRPIPVAGGTVRLRRGGVEPVRCDADGRFVLSTIDTGPVSLMLERAGLPQPRVVTGWFTLVESPIAGVNEVSRLDTQGHF